MITNLIQTIHMKLGCLYMALHGHNSGDESARVLFKC